MAVGLVRASVFAVTKEDTAGVYKGPIASDYVPLRPDNSLSFEPEKLDSDEFVNDIGATKSANGKENVSGSHSAYLKHSGVDGQEPELGVFYESLMGAKNVPISEQVTISGCTTTVLKVGSGVGASFVQGQAVIVKKANGYEIRNIDSIVGDYLNLNFALTSAPTAGVGLGKAITYLPVAEGAPTFSTTKNISNGFAKEISAGNTTSEASFTMDANGYGEVSFSFNGTNYAFNPILIGATNKYIDIKDNGGVIAVEIGEALYRTPVALAQAIEAALNASSVETYTCSFSSVTGKFTIASSTSVLLELLWNTGTNAANSIGITLGFLVASNDTGAVTYTSDNAQSYAASVTPAYDDDNKIVIKGAELFIGSSVDNVCICAQSVSITISKELTDVDCICEETGVSEKIPTSRTAEMQVTALMKKHDVELLNALLANTDVSAIINAGPKLGGNYIAGKSFNAYMQKATVSSYTTEGDSFAQVSITLSGFVTTSKKDIYLNFV